MERLLTVSEAVFETPVRKIGLIKKPVKKVNNKLTFRLTKDKSRLENLWKKFCKPNVVWELWEVRKANLDVFKYKPLFVEARRGDETVGLLPLWYNKKEKLYEWVSGWYAEESQAFVKNKTMLKKMLSKVDGPLRLECMKYGAAKLFPGKLVRDFDHFGLDLKPVEFNWDKYLMTLKKKKRENIRRDLRSIVALNPVIKYDDPNDLKHLFRLNKLQMRRKVKMYDDESLSVFETEKKHQKLFWELLKRSGGEYRARIISVRVKGKVVGCDFNLIYKKRYVTVLGGSNVKAVSGMGSFMNYLDIQDAINEKCDYVDFLMEAHYWKEDWFKPERRYKYVRNGPKTGGKS